MLIWMLTKIKKNHKFLLPSQRLWWCLYLNSLNCLMCTTLVAMHCAWHQYTTQNQHQCQQWCCTYMFLLSRQHTFGYMYFTFYQNDHLCLYSITQSLLNQDYSFMRGKCKYMAYIPHNVTFPFFKWITLTTSAVRHLHDDYIARFIPIVLEIKSVKRRCYCAGFVCSTHVFDSTHYFHSTPMILTKMVTTA